MSCKCYWDDTKGKAVCEIPVTLPTSKIRIKRKISLNGKESLFPVAPRKTEFLLEDYIEWQISYRDKNSDELIEFGFLLKEFYRRRILTQEEVCRVVNALKYEMTFEEMFKIRRDICELKFSEKQYKLVIEKTPILRIELNDGCFVDIALKHKQKAVGYQAMVYIYIPIKNLFDALDGSLIGRKAHKKETVFWYPCKNHIISLLEAFLIASKAHREDLIKIIKAGLGIEC